MYLLLSLLKLIAGTVARSGAMILSLTGLGIAVKEWMFWYTRTAAKQINSGALMADAWHHRSDALSSIGAFDIFKDALEKMVDKSCGEDVIQNISKIILEQDGVEDIDDIKTRLFGAKIYVDVEIAVDASKTLLEAHEVAQCVHDAIEEQFPEVKHCMVHENSLVSGRENHEENQSTQMMIR